MILAFEEAGAGPPVALLHGLFGRARNLGALARHLAPDFRVLSLDLRNHGASPHADGMDYATMAADIIETLASQDIHRFALLGHSMGGKAAMATALRHPDAVTSLLVADIAPAPYHHHNADIAAALEALPLPPGLTRSAASAALASAVPDPSIRAFLLQNLEFGPTPAWRIGLHEIARAIPTIEGWPTLPTTYPGKTLFLRAERSDYLLPEHQPAIHRLFPQASIETLAGAGHWLHADQPAAFAALTHAFFTKTVAAHPHSARLPLSPR